MAGFCGDVSSISGRELTRRCALFVACYQSEKGIAASPPRTAMRRRGLLAWDKKRPQPAGQGLLTTVIPVFAEGYAVLCLVEMCPCLTLRAAAPPPASSTGIPVQAPHFLSRLAVRCSSLGNPRSQPEGGRVHFLNS